MRFSIPQLLLAVLLGLYVADFFSLLNGDSDASVDVISSHPQSIQDQHQEGARQQEPIIHRQESEIGQGLGGIHDSPSRPVAEKEQESIIHDRSNQNVGSEPNVAQKQNESFQEENKQEWQRPQTYTSRSTETAANVQGSGSPMNRNIESIQIPANTGKLALEQVKDYYRRLVQAYLAPFKNGIYRQLFFEILRRRTYSLTPPGGNKGIQSILFQIIDKKVYILDPYDVPKNSKPFYRTRINEVIWLLSKLAEEGRIQDTEFLISIHDCVQTVNKPHTYRGAHYIESSPTFTIVACNFSDNIPFPMWDGDPERGGGLAGWDRKMEQYAIDITKWELKADKAVFRGGNRPSMYFQNKKDADDHCQDVGRTRLQYLGEENSDLFDISVGGTCAGKHKFLKRLATMDHHKYKYILYAEGNCFWADRLNKQLYGPSMIIKQETPCGQFFEPLLKPMTHYVPTDFFFTDTLDKVRWAREHDTEAKQIVANANEFASNFLTLSAIETYVEVLLQEYRNLLVDPSIKLENGAIDVTNKRV